MSDQQSAATREEIAESRRKCWVTSCKRTSRLEWCGWRYCIPHYWTQVLRDCDTWRLLLVKLRFTEIARHRRRRPKGPAGDRGQVGWMGGEYDK